MCRSLLNETVKQIVAGKASFSEVSPLAVMMVIDG